MAKKTKKSTINDEINDERFTAAATRPQFRKAKTASSHNNTANSAGGDSGGLIVSNKLDNNNALSATSSSGLGASLTQAIASDDRFKAALDSDKFGCVPTRDKYGRKTKKKKSKKLKDDDDDDAIEEEDDEEDEEDDESVEEDDNEGDKKTKKKEAKADIEQDNTMESRIAYLNALSRGDISASSSEESSDGESDDDSDDSSTSSTNIHGKSGIFDPAHTLPGDIQSDEEAEAELTFEPSPYLCILNLNWEHTRAVDVYAMLHSFCPPGTLKKVEVYPSDFGRERMEKERVEGPVGLWKKEKKGAEDEEGESEDESANGDEDDSHDVAPSESNTNNDDDDIQDDQSDESEYDSDEDSIDDEEDIINLAEATAKLYAHFPPQSTIMKNSQLQMDEEEEVGFDVEKLREYEASKLRYYFAIATFHSAAAAETVYENVDGMEMENSAAEIDVRVLPQESFQPTIDGRTLRDTCDQLPAKYAPPLDDATVTALRQSRVTCSWERGDAARENKLTKWGMGKDAWNAMAEGDDVKFYLATSDNSSGEESESEDDGDDEGKEKGGKKKKKGAGMRAMLGLAGSDSEEAGDQSISEDSSSGSDSDESKENGADKKKHSKSSSTESESESEDDEAETNTTAVADKDKQVTFTPGKRNLEKKIRSKLLSKSNADNNTIGVEEEQLTPFQKYLEKRKEKRRERKQAARGAKQNNTAKEDDDGDLEDEEDDDDSEDGGMYEVDPEFGVAQFSDEEGIADDTTTPSGTADGNDTDGFFVGETTSTKSETLTKKKGKKNKKQTWDGEEDGDKVAASTKEELELLIAGDDDEEHEKDYDMRGLVKLQKLNSKTKLKGKRKRQLETLAANISGQEFHVDTSDDRFAALLDGNDDRFGIDRTHSAYRETGAMKTLLQEQSERRRKKNEKDGEDDDRGGNSVVKNKKDGGGGWVENSSGAMDLSSLVKSLQQKVSKSGNGSKRKKKEKV